MKRLFILFFLPLLFLLGGCFKEKEIILNPSDGITPDQEWAVVKIPYAAFLEKTEYDSEVKSHGRLGDVFLVIGKEFVKKQFFDDESEKKRKSQEELELWYKFENGYLSASQVDIYDTKLKAMSASKKWKADKQTKA